MRMDPLIVVTSCLLLGFVLLEAGLHKLRNPRLLAAVIDKYRLLPRGSGALMVWVLGSAELLLAIGLLAPQMRVAAALLSGGLLTLYGVAIGINLARGRRHIDCGCGGAAAGQELSGALLVRNGLLVLLALMIATVAQASRPLGVWDWLIALFSGLAAMMVYLCANLLLANRQLLANLK